MGHLVLMALSPVRGIGNRQDEENRLHVSVLLEWQFFPACPTAFPLQGSASAMSESSAKSGVWNQTIWASIERARDGDREALGRVLERYRTPILREIQFRRRCTREDAEDLTHEFIKVWMGRDLLKKVDPARGGKFRTFLKTCVHNFLIDVHDKEVSRGKPAPHNVQSLSAPAEGGRPPLDPSAPPSDAGLRFDRGWAEAIFCDALVTLEQEYRASLRGPVFEALKAELGGAPTAERVQDLASRLGLTEEAVKTYRHRMRKRLRALIQEEVRSGCGPHTDWEEEFRYMFRLLSGTEEDDDR